MTMFPMDIDPTDSAALRERVERDRRYQEFGQKNERLAEALGELYDLRDARDWKGGITNEEKALVGEIEGLRTDLQRLHAQVQEEQNAEVKAANEKIAAEAQAEADKINRERGVEDSDAVERAEEANAKLAAEVEEALAQTDFTVPDSIHSDEGTEHASEPAEMDMRDLDRA